MPPIFSIFETFRGLLPPSAPLKCCPCLWLHKYEIKLVNCNTILFKIFQRFSRAGPRGRGREWATLGVHPLSWLLSNNQLEEVCGTLTKGTFSSQLLLSNQDKGCTPSVAHSLPLPPSFCSTCQLSIMWLLIVVQGTQQYLRMLTVSKSPVSSFGVLHHIHVPLECIFMHFGIAMSMGGFSSQTNAPNLNQVW